MASKILNKIDLTKWGTFLVAATMAGMWLIYRLLIIIYNLYLHPLAKFPGPKSTAFSRIPLVWAHFRGKQYQFIEAIHCHYGPVVRIAPDELTIIDPAAWKAIYARRPDLPKDPLSLQPPLNNAQSLFTAEGETHQRIRRLFSHSFSEKALRAQSTLVHSYADLLVERLKKVSQESTRIDISRWYGYTTVDILGDLTLGDSFSSLKNEAQHPWISSFFMGMRFSSLRTSLSRHWPLDWVAQTVVLKALSKRRLANWEFVTRKVTRRLEMKSERADFFSPIIKNVSELQESEGRNCVTRKELNTNALALIMAGAELPAVALSTATYYLLRNFDSYSTLCHEIRSAFKSESDITISSSESLPYLNAVIDESLRLHHPTPSPMPRVIPPGGLQVGSYWLPGGTIAGIAMGAILHSAANFSAPLEFHPERFLPNADHRFTTDNKEAFKPFSIGSRSCIGSKLAIAEMRLILSKMCWSFDMSLTNPQEDDWTDQRAWIVCENKPLWVEIKPKSEAVAKTESP